MWDLLCSISSYWYCFVHGIKCLWTYTLLIYHWPCDVDVDEELGAKSGGGTDYTCDNSSCSKAFHSICLGDWLRSITTTRQYVYSLSLSYSSVFFLGGEGGVEFGVWASLEYGDLCCSYGSHCTEEYRFVCHLLLWQELGVVSWACLCHFLGLA